MNMMKKATVYLSILSVIAASATFMPAGIAAEGDAGGEVTSSGGGEASTIQEYLQQALPENSERKIVLDEVTGVLTVTDTPSNQSLARDLIMLWDTGPSQVRIQARFVEIDVTDIQELGVEWSWFRPDRPELKNSRFSNMGVDAKSTSLLDRDDTNDLITNQFGLSNNPAGLDLRLGTFTAAGNALRVYIKALEEQGKLNLLSSPTVTTLSGQMANIQLANIVPYASDFTRTNIGSPEFPVMVEVYKVAEKVTGIMLEVTPTVAGDSNVITMDIHPEVSMLARNVGRKGQIPISASDDFPLGLGYPVVDTRTAQTSVVIKSGETIVIGGLIKEEETVTKRKVPFLGDIPLLGKLFKTDHTDTVKKNLLIFLTATVLNSRGEPVL
jgi:general secretion pathway protein D